jgi:hypothetical protein
MSTNDGNSYEIKVDPNSNYKFRVDVVEGNTRFVNENQSQPQKVVVVLPKHVYGVKVETRFE